jgi:prevent-host-death family protein
MSAEAGSHFNIHEAKTHLSRIVKRVERGEETVISRAGTPVAKIIPFPTPARRRDRGSLAGKIALAEDWDSAEVNEEVAGEFGLTS